MKINTESNNQLFAPDINTLSQRLCTPVGGFGPSLVSTLSAILGSAISISSTPTIAPTISKGTELSSILATATPAPNLGNPADLRNYPACAVRCRTNLSPLALLANNFKIQQICTNEIVAIRKILGNPIDLTNSQVACGTEYRGRSAGCIAATCNPSEDQKINLLAQQLRGYLYNANATLSSSVSAALVSATAAANAATLNKDPTDLTNYPACAVSLSFRSNLDSCNAFRFTTDASPAKMHSPKQLQRLRQHQ